MPDFTATFKVKIKADDEQHAASLAWLLADSMGHSDEEILEEEAAAWQNFKNATVERID